MSHQSSSTDRHVSPAQVWVRLATDCRMRAIRLMAQLAFKLVADQSDTFIEESNYVVPSRHAQNPA
jgi:hypothetical protein